MVQNPSDVDSDGVSSDITLTVKADRHMKHITKLIAREIGVAIDEVTIHGIDESFQVTSCPIEPNRTIKAAIEHGSRAFIARLCCEVSFQALVEDYETVE